MNKKILIVTASDEPNVAEVTQYLPETSFIRLDVDKLCLDRTTFFLVEPELAWQFMINGAILSAEDIGAVWYRRPTATILPQELPSIYKEFVERETQSAFKGLWSITEDESIFWMDRPEILREVDGNKAFQMKAAREAGLTIPKTMITNDYSAVLRFFEECRNDMVVKVFGGTPVHDLEDKLAFIYTHKVTKDELASFAQEIGYAPAIYQEYVPKALELRVTFVQGKLFPCAIHSQDSPKTIDDWRRYDFEHVKHESYELPSRVAEQLRETMAILQINFGAIDMVVTPAGDHVFLEVNPSGQWGWIEGLTRMPISKAIAETLLDAATKNQ